MYTFLAIVYVLVCLFLILVVLLQPGKGGMGGAFGGGSSQTVFGGSGAGNFLTRLTSISAALFMLLSATLAYMSSSSDKSLEAASAAAKAKAAAKPKTAPVKSGEDKPGDEGAAPGALPLNLAPGDESAPVQLDVQPAGEPQVPVPAKGVVDQPKGTPASETPALQPPTPIAPKPAPAPKAAKPAAPKPEAAAPAAAPAEAPAAENPAPAEKPAEAPAPAAPATTP